MICMMVPASQNANLSKIRFSEEEEMHCMYLPLPINRLAYNIEIAAKQ